MNVISMDSIINTNQIVHRHSLYMLHSWPDIGVKQRQQQGFKNRNQAGSSFRGKVWACLCIKL